MKKLGIMSVAMLSILTACSNSDDYTKPQPEQIVANVCKTPEFFVTSGHDILAQKFNTKMTRAGESGITYERETYAWESPLDIFEHFPEFKTPEGCYENFLFVSNGEPFDLVMLYSNGGYRHDMGIYWYENGECHEQPLWEETPDESNGYWVNFNGADSKGMISRVSDNAGAYKVQLPQGVRFGFYCHSTLYGNEVIRKVPLTPGGPEVECKAKFYTEGNKNWTNTLAEQQHMTLTTQAMTTNINGWTIVGFEDMDITWPSCDHDYNDCVFAINPQQHVDGKAIDGSVEVNLSVNDKHETGDYIATKLSIHVRANTDVEVFIPVDKKYYCVADDMDISASHKDLDIVYNTVPQYVDMNIGGSTVKFTVTYEDNGIRVTTNGINDNVIKYCQDTYKDGVTFEVWNYFTDALDRTQLKPMLDQSTVTFLTNQPSAYINAFGRVDGQKNPWDCIVKPTDALYVVSDEEAGQFNVKYVAK